MSKTFKLDLTWVPNEISSKSFVPRHHDGTTPLTDLYSDSMMVFYYQNLATTDFCDHDGILITSPNNNTEAVMLLY